MAKLHIVLDGVGGAVLIAISVLLTPFIRQWRQRWGATEAELKATLPGDEIVNKPLGGWTHAISIEAPIDAIWPWIVQIGCRRAGFYSYDLLDNGGIQSAEKILLEHQALHVGDNIPLVPKGDFGIPVNSIDPGRALVLGGQMPSSPEQPISVSWAFVLLPEDSKSTRLVSRWRISWTPSLLNNFAWGVMTEGIGFVMDRKMLLEIKRRVELISSV